MTDPEIREATHEDVPAIRRIGETAWRVAYGDLLDEETIDAAIAEWYDPDSIRDYVADERIAYFVAEAGEVVGYVSGGPSEQEGVAVLAAIYVHPDRWNEGVGSALIDRFEEFCRDRAYRAIQLRVLAENEAGRAFYRTHGYEQVEERAADLFGETVRECEFRTEL